MDTILVTGGAGFIGHHLCEHILHNTDWQVIVLDRLTYAGTLDRLIDTRSDFGNRIRFLYHDFRASFNNVQVKRLQSVNYIIHCGAETHVENSIRDPQVFVESNVMGTFSLLELARKLANLKRFVYISTDEVHGPAPFDVDFKEDAEIRPSNPYSASKAAGEALAFAWAHCYKVPILRTRTMNNFGERQHPEKFVPMVMRKVLSGETVPIHCVYTKIGSRKWLHARNHADAVLYLLTAFVSKDAAETYHIAGEELTNLDMARAISGFLDRELKYELVNYHGLRPGHDLRYSLDDSKLRALGWRPPVLLWPSLEKTVKWTMQHREWLDA